MEDTCCLPFGIAIWTSGWFLVGKYVDLMRKGLLVKEQVMLIQN